MPIKIPDALPATAILESENIFVMTEYRALHQDIRPLKVLLLNLMPTKIVTETQILRKLSNTPVQIQVELLRTASYQSQHTDEDHLASFYTTFDQVRDRNFDGMIITGAPVENLEFNQVDYWPELCEIMAWSRTHVHSTLHICWGAQAGLYFHHGIEKRSLPRKLFGVYEHRVLKPSSPLFRGFDDVFCAPHSRYTEVWEKDIRAAPGLELLATSSEAGVYAVKTEDSSQFFIMVEQAPHLDGQYASFGKVIEGMEVADAIVSAKRDWNDKPRDPQRMKRVTVETFGVDYPEPEKC